METNAKPDFKIAPNWAQWSLLNGYTHYERQGEDVIHVYRPAPNNPQQWGQRTLVRQARGWWVRLPSILFGTALPPAARPIPCGHPTQTTLPAYRESLLQVVREHTLQLVPPDSLAGRAIGIIAVLLHAAWTAARIVAICVALLTAAGFSEFIREEALQATGIAAAAAAKQEPQKGAEAEQTAAVTAALNSYLAQTRAAIRWHDRWGWLSPITAGAYRTYFQSACVLSHRSQLYAAEAKGIIGPHGQTGHEAVQRTTPAEHLRAAGWTQDQIEEALR